MFEQPPLPHDAECSQQVDRAVARRNTSNGDEFGSASFGSDTRRVGSARQLRRSKWLCSALHDALQLTGRRVTAMPRSDHRYSDTCALVNVLRPGTVSRGSPSLVVALNLRTSMLKRNSDDDAQMQTGALPWFSALTTGYITLASILQRVLRSTCYTPH